MVLWFYRGTKQHMEVSYQKWLFSYAYSIYYILFIARSEIKS
jgi:hypothetical protein